MNKSKFLLASLIVFSLIFGFGHNAYSWPWSKNGSNVSESKEKKNKKKQSKKKNKEKNKKSQKTTR